ncbi:hypothetical protein V5799_033150 [Amblyomma americanum]|uniref:Peptidase M13 C-terminal domain-containing protein n=1 Tax=Amblyomma americanum TaxID=6943 RepID=A0AAQ4DP52_AMBAM
MIKKWLMLKRGFFQVYKKKSDESINRAESEEDKAAYTQLLQEECQNIDTRLEGFRNISGVQLFFLGNAMTLCGVMSDFGLHWWMLSFDHSAYMYRVNISMQNSGEFAQAFNCPSTSPMYKDQDERCSFW